MSDKLALADKVNNVLAVGGLHWNLRGLDDEALGAALAQIAMEINRHAREAAIEREAIVDDLRVTRSALQPFADIADPLLRRHRFGDVVHRWYDKNIYYDLTTAMLRDAASAMRLQERRPVLDTRLYLLLARIELVNEVLEKSGCGCECGHHKDEHDDDCERCIGCRIEAVLRGAPRRS